MNKENNFKIEYNADNYSFSIEAENEELFNEIYNGITRGINRYIEKTRKRNCKRRRDE